MNTAINSVAHAFAGLSVAAASVTQELHKFEAATLPPNFSLRAQRDGDPEQATFRQLIAWYDRPEHHCRQPDDKQAVRRFKQAAWKELSARMQATAHSRLNTFRSEPSKSYKIGPPVAAFRF